MDTITVSSQFKDKSPNTRKNLVGRKVVIFMIYVSELSDDSLEEDEYSNLAVAGV